VNCLEVIPTLFKHIFDSAGSLHYEPVSSRIKDILFKQFVIIGIIRPILALTALASVEKELGFPVRDAAEQRATSTFLKRQESMNDSEARQIGRAHMDTLYQGNLEGIMNTWGAHRADIEWLEERVIYGMFLGYCTSGDSREEEATLPLNAMEVSLVTVSSIMSQNVGGGPPRWHVRGLMRLGVGVDDAERVCDIVKIVAKWAGVQGTESWICAKEVTMEV
jgi:hypothetical protein